MYPVNTVSCVLKHLALRRAELIKEEHPSQFLNNDLSFSKSAIIILNIGFIVVVQNY